MGHSFFYVLCSFHAIYRRMAFLAMYDTLGRVCKWRNPIPDFEKGFIPSKTTGLEKPKPIIFLRCQAFQSNILHKAYTTTTKPTKYPLR